MRISVLILLCLFTLITGCKKEEPKIETISLSNTQWFSYWYTSTGAVMYYKVLRFSNATDLSYSEVYSSPIFLPNSPLTDRGISQLKYSIDDPNKDLPIISITGTLNSSTGVVNAGEIINWKLDYRRQNNNLYPSIKDGEYFYLKF